MQFLKDLAKSSKSDLKMVREIRIHKHQNQIFLKLQIRFLIIHIKKSLI